MYYPSSKNKGAEQLHSYCEADLSLCFRISKNLVFSWRDSYCTNTDKQVIKFGVQWRSDRASYSESRGPGLDPHKGTMLRPWARNIYFQKYLLNTGSGGPIPAWPKNCWLGLSTSIQNKQLWSWHLISERSWQCRFKICTRHGTCTQEIPCNLKLYTFPLCLQLSIWAASWENQQSAYAKTKTQISFAVTAKLISAFVFATRIVLSYKISSLYLATKFQASSLLLWLYSLVCVGLGRKPHCWFSHEVAHLMIDKLYAGK